MSERDVGHQGGAVATPEEREVLSKLAHLVRRELLASSDFRADLVQALREDLAAAVPPPAAHNGPAANPGPPLQQTVLARSHDPQRAGSSGEPIPEKTNVSRPGGGVESRVPLSREGKWGPMAAILVALIGISALVVFFTWFSKKDSAALPSTTAQSNQTLTETAEGTGPAFATPGDIQQSWINLIGQLQAAGIAGPCANGTSQCSYDQRDKALDTLTATAAADTIIARAQADISGDVWRGACSDTRQLPPVQVGATTSQTRGALRQRAERIERCLTDSGRRRLGLSDDVLSRLKAGEVLPGDHVAVLNAGAVAAATPLKGTVEELAP